MKTVITTGQIKNKFEEILQKADQRQEVFIKDGQSLYRLLRVDRVDLAKNQKIQKYVQAYQDLPESAEEGKTFEKLSASVLNKDDWS